MSELDALDQLAGLFERTHDTLQRQAARAVDGALVARNWLFGWYIEAFERDGATRAEVYGKGVMTGLAERLKARGMRGCSVPSLNRFRQFYRAHAEIRSTVLSGSSEIGSTLLSESSTALGHTVEALALLENAARLGPAHIASLLNAFPLGWSHYLELMQLDNSDERRFYEIEAAPNQWSVRELRRQRPSARHLGA